MKMRLSFRGGTLPGACAVVLACLAAGMPAADAVTGSQIVDLGDNYLRVPYKFGASPSQAPRAMDCSSFTQYVFGRFGIHLKRTAREQATQGLFVAKNRLQPGDLLAFKTTSRPYSVDHIGIYMGDNKVLHTYGKPGVCIRALFGTFWGNHLVTARRMPSVQQIAVAQRPARNGGGTVASGGSARRGSSSRGGTSARRGSSSRGGTSARRGSSSRGSSGRRTVRVNARYLNVRTGGSLNARIVGHVRAGRQLTQIGISQNGNWRHVQTGTGRTAWIAAGGRWSSVVGGR